MWLFVSANKTLQDPPEWSFGLNPRGASEGMSTISQPKQTKVVLHNYKMWSCRTKTVFETYHTSVLLYLRVLHLVHRYGVSVFDPNFDWFEGTTRKIQCLGKDTHWPTRTMVYNWRDRERKPRPASAARRHQTKHRYRSRNLFITFMYYNVNAQYSLCVVLYYHKSVWDKLLWNDDEIDWWF